MLISNTTIEESSLKESSPFVTEDFHFRTDCTNIQEYPGQSFPWHWHEDLEILYVVKGKICVKIPQKHFILSEGEIIFLPSNILHSTEAVGSYDGIHKEYIFSPTFIGGNWSSAIMQKYVLPIIKGGIDHILITPDSKEYEKFTSLLNDIQSIAESEIDGFELWIHHHLEEAWMIIRSIALESTVSSANTFQNQNRLYKMLEYIQKNYSDDVSLDDIAASAGISARECNRRFKNSLGTTTMNYLLNYRISHACRMLVETDLPITTIGQNCGFSSASYFAKRFKEITGTTPKEFRK